MSVVAPKLLLNAAKAGAVEDQLIVGGRNVNGQMPGYSTEQIGYDGMMKLLSLKERPTAVFARNDFTGWARSMQ